MSDAAAGAGSSAVDIVDEAPVSRIQVTVFVLCALITVLDGFNTQAIAFVAPSIAASWVLSPWDFGLIFSATLLGSVIGTSVFGALADRFGRRRLTIAMTLLFAVFGGLTALTTGFGGLLLCRFIGGIGLGGVIPNTLALASEYAPRRLRATIVTATLWGFPAGAMLGGLISAPIIAAYGWRAVFVVGAAAPLALVPVLIAWLPESIQFLSTRRDRHEEAQRIIDRIAPGRRIVVPERAGREARAAAPGVASLLAPGLASTTLLLSTTMFLSLLLSYLLVNWVPMILSQGGMNLSRAILGTVVLNAGGIAGSFVISRILDRTRHGLLLLAGGYAISGLTLVMVGTMSGPSVAALAVLAICGFFLIGSQISTTSYSAQQFPVELRGTGIGVVQGIGRLGSLVGPMAGGAMLSAGLSPRALFSLCLVPAVCAASALFALSLVRRGMPSSARPAAGRA